MHSTPPVYDERKLRELILYVAGRCETHERFGATKLNKILFYSDFIAYRKLGHPVTGARYQKLPYGPAPLHFLPVERELLRDGSAHVRPSAAGMWTEQRLIALREPDLSLFTADEIALVDQVIDMLRKHTATKVSDLSHRFPGWKRAKEREEIPYHTVFMPRSHVPLSAADARWAQTVAERYAHT